MRQFILPALLAAVGAAPGLLAAGDKGSRTGIAALEFAEAVTDSIRRVVAECHPETANERVRVEPLDSFKSLDWDPDERVVGLVSPTRPCSVGRITWFVRLQKDDRVIVKPVGVDVRREVRALVLQHDLVRGGSLSAADVGVEWVDVTYRRNRPIITLAGRGPLSMRRRGTEGAVLTEIMVETTPVVRRGESVVVRYSRDGFEIRLGGEAREDGQIGQQIKVKNLESGETINATVVAPGEVRL